MRISLLEAEVRKEVEREEAKAKESEEALASLFPASAMLAKARPPAAASRPAAAPTRKPPLPSHFAFPHGPDALARLQLLAALPADVVESPPLREPLKELLKLESNCLRWYSGARGRCDPKP